MGAAMLRGCCARDLSVHSGTEGLQPPSCQAAWAGKSEGRCWPHASSPTCPQLGSGAGGRRTVSTPGTAKETSVGMPPPLHPESPGGTAESSGPTLDCNSFPKGNTFSSPVQTGTDTQAVLAAPASAAVPARRRAVPAWGKSSSPAAARLFTVRTPAWHGPRRLGTPRSCRGTACCPPATSTQEEPPSPQGGDPNSGDTKCPHGQEEAALKQMVFAELPQAFQGPSSYPQRSSSRTQGQTARLPHSSQMGDPLPRGNP